MSKKYMDFVPSKNADRRAAVISGAPRRTNVATTTRVAATRTVSTSNPKVLMPEPIATSRTRTVRKNVLRKTTSRRVIGQTQPEVQQKMNLVQGTIISKESANGLTIRDEVKMGEIEDLSPKFVNKDVPKRPLGNNSEHKVAIKPVKKDDIKEAKSKRLVGMFRGKSATGNESKTAIGRKTIEKEAFVTPKPMFINQDKVAKRPLSKNVYQKSIVTTKEPRNKAPVAIIAKPEKESKIGLVVAIVLTIVLGAVAGTVAFLLLPK